MAEEVDPGIVAIKEALEAIWPTHLGPDVKSKAGNAWSELIAVAAMSALAGLASDEDDDPPLFTGLFDRADYEAFFLTVTSAAGLDEGNSVEECADIIISEYIQKDGDES